MDGEQVEVVLGKDREQLVEHRRVVKTDPRFHREPCLHRLAQRAKDAVHAFRLA